MGGSRPMTFTGCWTCKARKIRCDETPVSCKNCQRKGVTCGGYGIRLQWVSDPFAQTEKASPSGVQGRRSIKLDRTAGQRNNLEDIDNFLMDIDNTKETKTPLRKGPFSAFPALEEDHAAEAAASTPSPLDLPIASNLAELLDAGTEWRYDEYSTDPESAQGSATSVCVPLIEASPSSENTETRSLLGDHIFEASEEVDPVTELLADDMDFDSNANQSTGMELVQFNDAIDPSLEIETISSPTLMRNPQVMLSGDSETDGLINHYMVHVAEVLQPLLHNRNPYRYRGQCLTTALQGAVDNLLDPKVTNPTIYSTLYHAVLASSAFHLWNCNKSQARYRQIGESHQYNALHSLSVAVQTPTSGADYQTLMMAMLSLVTIGVVSGEGDDIGIHLDGATRLRNSRTGWKVISRQTRQLNEISFFLSLLIRTITLPTSLSPWHEKDPSAFDEEDTIIQENTCYEYMYGLTPRLAAAILETCRLAGFLSWYDESDMDAVPEDLLQACEALGEKLTSWTLESETIVSIPPEDDYIFTIFYHQIYSWYHAALIFYYRRIQRWDYAAISSHIDQTMFHLHAAEQAKVATPSSKTGIMAPITWPGFIASCDARGVHRETCIGWWERVQFYGLANIDRQWIVVQQIWDKFDQLPLQQQQSPEGDWINIYRNLGIHVLPV